MNVLTVKQNITGPIPSIRTPFTKDGEIDWKGLANMVDFLVEEAKAKCLLLTNGDSLFSVLSDSEVYELTEKVIEYNRGRAMVIVGTKPWSTVQSMEFFEFARKAGADVGALLLPDWAQSADVDACVDAVRMAGQRIPTLVLTNLINGRGLPLGVLKKLVEEKTPGFVGVKDDMCGVYGRRMAAILDGKYALMSGGRAENHLDVAPYQADGYLSIFISFYPQLCHAYWDMFTQKDYAGCAKWIRSIEWPYMDMISENGLNFDAAIHGMMELVGVCGRYRRAPYSTLTEQQMELLKDYANGLHL